MDTMRPTSPHPVRVRAALELETATAMFVHGARPEGRAELRPPSLKSIVRWWYRAALGPLQAELCDPNREPCGRCLRCHESEVFGSTATGPRVRFRVDDWYHHPAEGAHLHKATTVLLPHRRSSDGPVHRHAIAAGRRFTLLLDAWPLPSDLQHLHTAARSTWLVAQLGGFGQRTRRGAGSVELKGCPGGNVQIPVLATPVDAGEVAAFLGREVPSVVAAIRSTVHRGATLRTLGPGEIPNHPSLLLDRSDVCRIVVIPTAQRREEEARAWVMRHLFKHPVWGLPYTPPQGPKHPDAILGSVRQASPVWVHLHRTREGYAAVFTLLRSRGSERNARAARRIDDGFAELHGHLDRMPAAIDISQLP